ncbi:hypothetical protein EVAR_4981_1 [Eumeta japonica]|uniref:Uncharacterized protein n=1 Tax=Eumeta variegata TaxID=151549 RepID=A0A4C1UZ18_EUMVA|nr:hypothetical protein EVAR_4981_1 [Eumeta japonica]
MQLAGINPSLPTVSRDADASRNALLHATRVFFKNALRSSVKILDGRLGESSSPADGEKTTDTKKRVLAEGRGGGARALAAESGKRREPGSAPLLMSFVSYTGVEELRWFRELIVSSRRRRTVIRSGCRGARRRRLSPAPGRPVIELVCDCFIFSYYENIATAAVRFCSSACGLGVAINTLRTNDTHLAQRSLRDPGSGGGAYITRAGGRIIASCRDFTLNNKIIRAVRGAGRGEETRGDHDQRKPPNTRPSSPGVIQFYCGNIGRGASVVGVRRAGRLVERGAPSTSVA